jgi:hypothetical protein
MWLTPQSPLSFRLAIRTSRVACAPKYREGDLDAPMNCPYSSRTGDTVRETSGSWPPLVRRTVSKYCIGLLLANLYAIAPALFCQITGSVGSAERLQDLGHFLVQIEHTNAHSHCKGAFRAHESVLRDPFADSFR